MNDYKKGLKAGIPIGLGYLSVSFSFGIMAIGASLSWWQALIISMLTLTSAGQLAGIGIMPYPGRYLEMLIAQSTINIRYSFMSISLSQKTDSKFKSFFKWLFGFFVTDEIFAVAISQEKVSRSYFGGLVTLPYFGWAIGTLIGAVVGNILPEIIMSALCLAMYGMFIAVLVPKAKEDKKVIIAILIAIMFGVLLYYVPILKQVPQGIAISISAVVAALICAFVFPKEVIKDE